MSLPLYAPAAVRSWQGEFRGCLALSWPLALTNAIEMAMNLISLLFIGHLGPEALAASTLAMAFESLFLLFGIGVTAAVAPLIARETGAGRDTGPAVRRVVQQGLWGAAIITAPMWVVLWNAEPILVSLGQEPALAAAAASYLHVLQWSILPALCYLVLRSFFASFERPRWAVVTGAGAIALNAALNWLLVGGHGSVPGLGLVGSGVATLLSNSAMALALALVAVRDPRLRVFRVFSGLAHPQWTGFPAFWRLGLPNGVSLLLETGMFAAAAALIGRLDVASLAAHAIALQVASLAFMVPLGLAQAATIRIGRAAGARDGAGIVRAGWTALSVGLATMVVSATVMFTAPTFIVGLFLGSDPQDGSAVLPIATTLLGCAGLFQIADGAQVVLAGMLRGLQDTRVPMIIAAVGYWGVGIPLGAFLAFTLHMRAPGVWLGLTAGLFTVAGLLLARWCRFLGRQSPAARRGS